MGTDCRILLPPPARLRDVADVMGALAGLPNVRHELQGANRPCFAAHTEGITVSGFGEHSGLAECAKITFQDKYVMYHFEGSRKGERLIMPRSTAFWIAIGHGLVDFFGGQIDYSDCDDRDCDYKSPAKRDIHAEDGEQWDRLQIRKSDVRALSHEQIRAFDKHAAYKGVFA